MRKGMKISADDQVIKLNLFLSVTMWENIESSARVDVAQRHSISSMWKGGNGWRKDGQNDWQNEFQVAHLGNWDNSWTS